MSDGIDLERAELLAVLDSVRALSAPGLERSNLFPREPELHSALVGEGRASLQRRGLLRAIECDVAVLEPALQVAAAIMAHPETVMLTLRSSPVGLTHVVRHYCAGLLIVEYTSPESNAHRLASIPDLDGLLERVSTLFDVTRTSFVGATGTTELETFVAVKSLAETSEDAATNLLPSLGFLDAGPRAALWEALIAPKHSCETLLLRLKNGVVLDARDVLMIQGPGSAWLMRRHETDDRRVVITSGNQALMRRRMHLELAKLGSGAGE